jgi:hypothetical protein
LLDLPARTARRHGADGSIALCGGEALRQEKRPNRRVFSGRDHLIAWSCHVVFLLSWVISHPSFAND